MAEELEFEWNSANLEHLVRHGVTREEVEEALLNDPLDSCYRS